MPNDIPLYGLVLAGGESRRMGVDKARLRHGNDSQLAAMFELLQQQTTATFVSVRASQIGEAERQRFPQIVDVVDDAGPLAGIVSAMRAHPQADWLVLACDLPNVSGETLRHLVATADPARPFAAYKSSYDGLPEPLCAIYRHSALSLLESFLKQGVRCPRKILLQSDTDLLQPLDASALDNINTPDDLAASILKVAQ